ncbi:MAG TPA: endonuclease/exonuclease/phosphatase family protein [Blastocatellia bacterium]|nr:endonuclease/exonuclease/phosphatase family protein [Blastocatellia bacterium]
MSYRCVFSILAAIPAIASLIAPSSGSDCGLHPLLEHGRPAGSRKSLATLEKLKVVSYNIRWRGGDDLRSLIELLKNDGEIGGAAILGLQEVDRDKQRTGNVNTCRLISEALGHEYVWAAPPAVPAHNTENPEEETGVAILSAFPLGEVCRIVLPHPGPHGRRRVALGATVTIGDERIRVYSVHAETRIPVDEKMGQLGAVLSDLKDNHTGLKHAIVLGDFNTWEMNAGGRTRKLFAQAGFTTPFNSDPTWSQFLFRLKLDWIWLRGFRVKSYGIDRKVKLSDHWPLKVELEPN